MWVGKKTRPDILVALSFFGKRTERVDEDGGKKLKRLITYLKGRNIRNEAEARSK